MAENWSLPAEERKIFETQFYSLGPIDGNITGDKARGFFFQSGLPPNILAFIWELSDVTRDGMLNLTEFLVACKLIQMKLRNFNIPPTLPLPLLEMITAKEKSSVQHSVTSPTISPLSSIPIASVAPQLPMIGSVASQLPVIAPTTVTIPILPQSAAIISSMVPVTTVINSTAESTEIPSSPPTAIPGGSVSSHSASSGEATPAIGSPAISHEWSVPYNTKLRYTQMFNQADKNRTGFLPGNQARSIIVLTQLPIQILAKVWELADIDGDGQLTCEEFVLAMHLCDLAKSGQELKSPLPQDLLPPTFVKKTRQNSTSSVGSNDGIAPVITPIQAAFEDKRRENYQVGQAELEKRRQVLLEIQKQEKEERERVESEEQERKEKIRLEQERRREEELEKQLQIQREIEKEKEIERLKALEQRENSRREMERQRYMEWESKRIQDLQMRMQKELDYVKVLREKNEVFNTEYQSLSDKVRELTQQTGETRNGVNAVKSTIDGMRSSRDALLSDITSLKGQLKEQNQRLITLNKEKANLEAKKNTVPPGKTDEQISLDISNEQEALNQLRKDVQQIKEELEKKKLEYNNNVTELKDLKDKVTEVFKTCEEIYSDFRCKKEEVLKFKAKKLQDDSSWGNSAWDSAPDAWSEPAAAGESRTRTVCALYEFVARNDDELSFQPGDIITISITQNTEPGWLAGEFRGKTGWFPESYVENIDETSISTRLPVRDAFMTTTSVEPPLEDIAEVPENVSDASSVAGDAFGGPAAEGETPSLDAGTIANLAVQVLYQWNSKDKNQLSLTKGDIIRVSRKSANWFYGEYQGYSGWFPASFVKEITTSDNIEPVSDFDEYCIAIYTYTAKEKDDLSFQAGDVIKITKKDGDWWTGVLNGKCGVFPSNYVEKTDYQPTFSPLSESSKIPRCASAPPTQFENQVLSVNRSMTPDFGSMSETESAKKKPEIATVIAPYKASSKEQLSLIKGQLIMIRKKTNSGWWEGESHVKGKKRQVGWFPASYVKVVGGSRVTSPVTSELTRKLSFPAGNQAVTSTPISLSGSLSEKVIALYKYNALNSDELSFEKGDVIEMISKEEPDWWKGKLNEKVGLFPRIFY